MNFKILILITLLKLGFSTELIAQNQIDYDDNLNQASELYVTDKKIPESILLKLVPENYDEFDKYYRTTSPDHKLGNTDFFYETTQMIFNEVISKNNSDFYLSSLKLASFADGEYAENFIHNLELIIEMDEQKFCKSINGKEYSNQNPIKYYSELKNCE
ncbi:hypothetical protein LB452_13325 [Psychroflexus sp. CAK8W]|uniref:Uncharacterized protein n=1 Tax=Psychroflexus longus TaxID=2873596 RepID=A0ABS7XN54_9FLAO|nr:hypothetical protein [Psychroflexus longus]MBZ9779904.1 hypothetical protein [Psychroflexus longus]